MQTVNYSDYIYYSGTTQPVVRVDVYVYDANTTNLATLYDSTGASLANPIQTDDDGLFDFWTTYGKYDLFVHNEKQYSVSLLNLAYFYLGAYVSAPTQRPDGSSLRAGDMYFDSSLLLSRIYYLGSWYTGSAGDAALIVYDPSGTGAVSTFVQSELRKTFRTSDYDTFQHAIAAATGHELLVDSTVSVSASFSISTYGSVGLNVVTGGLITIAAGQALTIDVPFSCGLFQCFSGLGSVVLTKVFEVYPEWWGAVADGTTDCTDSIASAISVSSTQGVPVKMISGTYRCRGIDFRGKGYASIEGIRAREYGGSTVLRTIGTANITVGGETIFVCVNAETTPSVAVRSVGLYNIELLEDAGSTRTRGISATNTPMFQLSNVTTYGFDKAARLAYLWNSRADNLRMYNFRTSGLSMAEGNSNFGNINGLFLSCPHASSDQNPSYNFDLRGSYSVQLDSPVSEGTCVSHFYVDSTCRSILVNNLHTEGGLNFILVDLDNGSPTYPFCDMTFVGGLINLPTIDATSSYRFVNTTGSTANVGIANLALRGTRIKKGSTLPINYFDLSRVCVFDSTAEFEINAVAAVNYITWINVAKSIGANMTRGRYGHTGILFYDPAFRSYSGHRYMFTLAYVTSLSSTPKKIARLELETDAYRVLQIGVSASDLGSTSYDSDNRYALFRVAISRDFYALSSTEIVAFTSSTYAKDTVFSIRTTITAAANNGSGLIRITSASHGFATDDRVKVAQVTGTTEANGYWYVTYVDANNFDLQGSTFANAYVSGGICTDGYLKATNATAWNYGIYINGTEFGL